MQRPDLAKILEEVGKKQLTNTAGSAAATENSLPTVPVEPTPNGEEMRLLSLYLGVCLFAVKMFACVCHGDLARAVACPSFTSSIQA